MTKRKKPKRKGPRATDQSSATARPSLTRFNDRFVAFLDILGFSDRLRDEPLEALHSRYAALIDQANAYIADTRMIAASASSTPASHRNFDHAEFIFDSVVLVSKEMTPPVASGNAFNFLSAVSTLLEHSFAAQMPLRGCIGFGSVLRDDARRIVLSEAFPALLKLEKRQEWAGCIIHGGAERLAELVYGREPIPTTRGAMLVRHRAPLKDGDIENALCVNWADFLAASELEHGLEFLRAVPTKHTNTAAFANRIRGLPVGRNEYSAVSLGTVVAARAQITIAGVRFRFEDVAGNAADPPAGTEVILRIVE